MSKVSNHNRFLKFRSDYPEFTYQGFSIERNRDSLHIRYDFDLSGKFSFHPELELIPRDIYNLDTINDETLQNLAFHIGMVELISYWKAACPPKVIIKSYYLDAEQVRWWKKLYFHGLGEFFYLNDIDTDMESFMNIESGSETVRISDISLSDEKVLVPVGGGKDSVVTLEILRNSGFQIFPFVINPREATERTVSIAGFDENEVMIIRRTLDQTLLDLNAKGYLNGHTPFSSLLAFVSVLSALASGSKYIALSNESSANESTVPGSKINHQYSKSYEFETDFRWYISRYIHPTVHYFSFLRPLNELQIAALFSRFPKHFQSFRSCNVGSKTDSWCGDCPKCLFTWIILSPFVSPQELTAIFGKNLLLDTKLRPVFDELSGTVDVKPFECVGTPEEVKAALGQNILIHSVGSSKLIQDFQLSEQVQLDYEDLLHQWNNDHSLPEVFLTILKDYWNEIQS
ncbi:MAG: hypothetical protein JXR71_00600 [Bacteroidales bacterium]|nr:hypothetical protein [Bacteroidales bacterium]